MEGSAFGFHRIGRVLKMAAPFRPCFDRIAAFDRILRLSKARTRLFSRAATPP